MAINPNHEKRLEKEFNRLLTGAAIAFDNIRVGDEIRSVTTRIVTGVVTFLEDEGLIIDELHYQGHTSSAEGERQFFLVKRTEPVPGTLWIDRNGSVWVKTGDIDRWSYIWTGIGPRPLAGRGTNRLTNVRPWNVGDLT